jgi:hypothetical protein
MAKEKYMKIHDGLCTQIHFNICKKALEKVEDGHWYEHVPKPVETSYEDKVTVLWNQQVKTDRTCRKNKPDIKYRGNDVCLFMDN